MAAFAQKLDKPLASVLALGDNFYGKLEPSGLPAFRRDVFQGAFELPILRLPWQPRLRSAVHSRQGRAKAQIQLDYAAQNPTSRWKMPNRWYAVELPNPEKPLGQNHLSRWEHVHLGPDRRKRSLNQRKFLRAELQKETKAPWRWIVSHFPLFTERPNARTTNG